MTKVVIVDTVNVEAVKVVSEQSTTQVTVKGSSRTSGGFIEVSVALKTKLVSV